MNQANRLNFDSLEKKWEIFRFKKIEMIFENGEKCKEKLFLGNGRNSK